MLFGQLPHFLREAMRCISAHISRTDLRGWCKALAVRNLTNSLQDVRSRFGCICRRISFSQRINLWICTRVHFLTSQSNVAATSSFCISFEDFGVQAELKRPDEKSARGYLSLSSAGGVAPLGRPAFFVVKLILQKNNSSPFHLRRQSG